MTKLEKVVFVGHVFMGGAKAQLKQEWTIGAAAAIGLSQGLKYNGSIKKGIAGATATLTVLAVANGFSNIMQNWDKIQNL